MREEATLYAARCSSALAIACATVLPLQRRRGRCVTICINVHAGERHFGSTYFLSVAMAGAACGRSAAGRRVSQVFTPFLRKAQTSAAFVYSLCAPIRIKFVLLFHSPLPPSHLVARRRAGGRVPRRRTAGTIKISHFYKPVCRAMILGTQS